MINFTSLISKVSKVSQQNCESRMGTCQALAKHSPSTYLPVDSVSIVSRQSDLGNTHAFPRHFARLAAMVTLLLTFACGNVWAADQTISLTDLGATYTYTGFNSTTKKLKSYDRILVEVPSSSSAGTVSWCGEGSAADRFLYIYKTNGTVKDETRKIVYATSYGSVDFTSSDILTAGGKYYLVFATTHDWKAAGVKYVLSSAKYTLSYNANGGTGSMPSHEFISGTTVYAGQNAGFTRSGYIFTGWKTAASSGTAYQPGESFTLSANTTLYAQWATASTSGTYCISEYNLNTSDAMVYFTWVRNDEQIIDGALPDYQTGKNNYWVGKNGSWYNDKLGNSNSKSANAKFEDMDFLAARGTTIGTGAQKVLGTIHIYDKSFYDNLYPAFTPKSYVLMWGADGSSWTTTRLYPSGWENEWTSEVVSLTSTQISTWKYYVGFLKSDGGGAFMWKSKTVTLGSMGTYNKRTTTWGSNVSTLSDGTKGFFRMWQDETDEDNWLCHFVQVYTLSYNANGGTGAPANAYVATEGDAADRTIKVSTTEPTRNGYSFQGWATSSANASAGTVAYAPGAEITLSANQELWAVWVCVDPTITTDLSESQVDYNVGDAATSLTVAATAAGGTISYQWYSNTAKSTSSPTPTTLANCTTATYNPSTAAAGTTYYFCKITNSTAGCSNEVYSKIAKIVVSRKDPTTYTFSADNTSICSGDNVTFTLAGSQVGATYYVTKSSSGGSAIGDSKAGTGSSLSFTVSSATAGDYYCYTSETTSYSSAKVSKAKVTISHKTATSISSQPTSILDATVGVSRHCR